MLLALAGCDKEKIPEADAFVEFGMGVQGYDQADTKSLAADNVDDEVDRIDVYAYDDSNSLLFHKVIEDGGNAMNLSSISFRDYGANGEKRYYLFLANLDEDSADYIATLSGAEVNGYPKGYIPWSAGNCRPNRPIMAGTARATFNSYGTQGATVSLWRYAAKFEIGSIDAQFWGDPDKFRNIYLSHIVFSNSWDIVRICQSNAANFEGEPSDIFGPKGWSSGQTLGSLSSLYYNANQFLGQDEWSQYGLTFAELDNTYAPGDWGAGGKLDDAFDYLYNNNYMQPKNTICLDAPASLVTVSQQSWDNNAYLPKNSGKLCDEYEGSLGPFAVNKVFYTLPTCLFAYFSQPAFDPESGQDRFHKLVIAVKINGKNYYYPFYLHHLQPNMCYKINTITLKGEPSEYANVWPRGGVVSRTAVNEISENQWRVHGNVAEIDNLVLEGGL